MNEQPTAGEIEVARRDRAEWRRAARCERVSLQLSLAAVAVSAVALALSLWWPT